MWFFNHKSLQIEYSWFSTYSYLNKRSGKSKEFPDIWISNFSLILKVTSHFKPLALPLWRWKIEGKRPIYQYGWINQLASSSARRYERNHLFSICRNEFMHESTKLSSYSKSFSNSDFLLIKWFHFELNISLRTRFDGWWEGKMQLPIEESFNKAVRNLMNNISLVSLELISKLGNLLLLFFGQFSKRSTTAF